MATLDQPLSTSTRISRTARPPGSVRFDLIVTLLGAWFVGGLFLDGWAHNHGRVDNTFFTPWHGVLYSGYAAVGLFLVITHFRNVAKGYNWWRALPTGYMVSLLGVLIFGFGGVFDMFWHQAFGFEANTEALLSPAHLILALGSFIFGSGPIRAAYARKHARGWRDLLPLVLTLAYMLSALTFFTMFISPFSNANALIAPMARGQGWVDGYGVGSALVASAMFMGVILFALRRWSLPVGSITVILTINSTLMFLMQMRAEPNFRWLLLVAPLTGLLADALLYFYKPSAARLERLRLFSFVVPFVYFLLFMLLLNQVGIELYRRGLWWTIHMWAGMPLLCGATGVFASYLIFPPAIPTEESA
ncbi:MAG: hypothetical protein J0M07_23860 [Anaerolineae bacterium]|nr:hypothetical protein [Anaerolineae bacterium]